MTCGDQLGAIQTQGTCWFYSILNGFILSEDGQKILYARLKEFYHKLTDNEKEYFNDGSNAPCPLKDLTKVKKIHFWKFVDNYLCFMSGPRARPLKMGKSVELLGNVSLTGTMARQHTGAKGGHPYQEIPKVLAHLGFKEMNGLFKSHKDFLVVDFNPRSTKLTFDHRQKPKFIIVKGKTGYMEISTPASVLNDPDYSLMCSSIVIGNSKAKSTEMHKYHAIAGYVCDGHGYIYDSNQRKVFKCDYWDWPKLKKVLDDEVGAFYNFFKGGQINYYGMAFHVLARNDYVKNIAPACRLKKNLKTPKGYDYLNFSDPSLGLRLENPAIFPNLKPAERAALIRKWARTNHRPVVYLNKNVYNSIVNSSTNFESGNTKLRNFLSAGYRVKDPKDYDEFLQKLRNKFKPKTYTFAEAKARLNQFSGSTKAVRKHQYSLVWKGVPLAQRRVLMHWRNTGKWVANNAFVNKGKPPIKRKSPPKSASPVKPKSASPETKRKTKLVANFEKYWSALSSENRQILRNWNNTQFKSPVRQSLNKQVLGSPSNNSRRQSPVKNTSVLNAAKRNVNALKTAKARKEYRRKRATNMTQNNWMALGKYINDKNFEARQKRDEKKKT